MRLSRSLTLGNGGTVSVGGETYLTMPNGDLMPLAYVIGTGYQPQIAGTPTGRVLIDAGSDTAHAKILYTFNAYGGDPDTADTALASARFVGYASNAQVIDLNITGGSAGSITPHSPETGIITMVHLALPNAGPYTQAAGATVTAAEMVLCKWDSSLNITSVVLYIGESYVGGGSNQRYREVVVMGHAE